ncbi:uncharacterized protein BO95DRAFT_117239 [Aspergillus brunneoviolaceus CBS 621.78]|uniref:Uncharacterized protein n=1 Tax=Aspergillus brunneoviolaceus CBS 621.78 TaxID=1450534 RepID=A0ACD1GNI9_9EURO|nr:hypothetical protein BO95DRAFT_117239 [Aspergillus brunneoviolaceus CBS 621.78]RAH50925.1 hypothetical protein BO95DRAFT_117239 [Aspergillus brunneoviolaceus CBS 621.78]
MSESSESVLSILTGQSWFWDPMQSNEIRFHPNGAGHLICRYETQVWIMAELHWRSLRPASLEQIAATTADGLLGEFEIEIRLSKRQTPGTYVPPGRRINEALLTDEAFEPKLFTVRLERGSFLTQHDRAGDRQGGDASRWAMRLVFDKSPYPQPEEWKEMTSSLQAHKMWEWNEFCSHQLPEKGLLAATWSKLRESFVS